MPVCAIHNIVVIVHFSFAINPYNTAPIVFGHILTD